MLLPLQLQLNLPFIPGGITQPGGVGTTIFFTNNAHPDALGDGSYQFADISAKYPADFIDNTNGSYRSKVSLQNGDGVSILATTLSDTLKTVSFDAGKTYTVSVVGLANRTTQWGTKIGTNAAKDGCDVLFGANPIFRGIINLYGNKLRSTAGMTLTPLLGGVPVAGVGELIGNSFQWGNAGSQFGSPSSGNFAVMLNNNFVGVGAVSNITNFSADVEDGSVFSGTGMNRFLNTSASQLNLSRPSFRGVPVLADIRDTHGSGIDWNFAEPSWSQNAVQFDNVVGVLEWWGFQIEVFDPRTNTRKSGIPVELVNAFGATVVDAVTDSEGRVSFGLGVSLNRVVLRRYSGGGTIVIAEYAPMTLKMNHKGAINYAFLPVERKILWPGVNYAQGRQLSNLSLSEMLVPVTPSGVVANEEFRSSLG